MAKERSAPYRPGERRGMFKVKRTRTLDAVVAGWRPGKEPDTVGALILGLYDGDAPARRRPLLRPHRRREAPPRRLPRARTRRASAAPPTPPAGAPGATSSGSRCAPSSSSRSTSTTSPPGASATAPSCGAGARTRIRASAPSISSVSNAQREGGAPSRPRPEFPAPRRVSIVDAMTGDSATVGEEEYLQILFWLQEAGLPMTGANVARAMQLSAPTVHEMVGRLERDGYITRGQSRAIAFTDDGAAQAESIVRRHRLIERFLTDVLGVPWDEVHEEAERLEHAMSPVLEQRMLAAIGDAKTCPHGHPIVAGAREAGVPLADVAGRCRCARAALRERGRGPAALPQGLRPGARAAGHARRPRPPRGRRRDRRRAPLRRHPLGRRDRLGGRRPLAAAAHRSARAVVLGQQRYGR